MRCALISMVISSAAVASGVVPSMSWPSCGADEVFVSARYLRASEKAEEILVSVDGLNRERLRLLAEIQGMPLGEDRMLLGSLRGELESLCDLAGHRRGVRHEHLAIMDRELEKRGFPVVPAMVCEDDAWGWMGCDDHRDYGSEVVNHRILKGIIEMLF